ncbi:hypothetical protein GBAR_LOCUS16267, partial [Geodia barretti]
MLTRIRGSIHRSKAALDTPGSGGKRCCDAGTSPHTHSHTLSPETDTQLAGSLETDFRSGAVRILQVSPSIHSRPSCVSTTPPGPSDISPVRS